MFYVQVAIQNSQHLSIASTNSMSTDRRICPACGANNFSTQQSCWSCNAALGSQVPTVNAVMSSDDTMIIPAVAVALLSLLSPFVSLCAGLLFLMQPGRRNTTLGWWNIIAGVIGTALHLVALAVLLPSITSGVLSKTLSGLTQQKQQNDLNQSQSILNGLQ